MREIIKGIILEYLEKAKNPVIYRNIKLSESSITALVGPRRAGKTSAMIEMIQKLDFKGCLFIDFEDYRLVNLKNFEVILECYQELFHSNPKYLFFDEIQSLKNWQNICRSLHNRGYILVISGSSSKLLSKEIATELRGRYLSKLILPFSFREFLSFKNIIIDNALFHLKKGILLSLFDEYLAYGGFCEVIKKERKEEKKEILKSYYETIFYKDLSERYKISDPENFLILMNYILSNFSSYFSISKYYKILKSESIEISKKTISKYIYELAESFFILPSEKYSLSASKRIFNPKKLYLIDNGFSNLMNFSEDKGKLLENCVAIELKRRNCDFFYFNDKNECDFLIKEGPKIKEAIQITYDLNEKNKKREFSGIEQAMNRFNLKEGTILTYNIEQEGELENKKIKVLPVWKWLLN